MPSKRCSHPLPIWSDPKDSLPSSSIILVTYNKIDLTLSCLESLYATTEPPFEVIIVDNASSDATVPTLRSLTYPNLRIIANQQNLGFGRGCNVGASAAKGEVLVFLNNDTLLSHGWLTRMLRRLAAHPRLGLVGPMTNVASNLQLLPADYSSRAEDVEEVAARLAAEHGDEIVLLRRVIGFCMVLPKRVWDDIGPFDDAFGIGHYEDDDLSLRVERHGYFSAVARDSYVHHFAGQSFAAAGIDSLRNIRQKAYLFYKKWGNAYLDWPDLRQNLTEALHVVSVRRSAADARVPGWQPEWPHFLVTAVAPGATPTHREGLASAYGASQLFDFFAWPRAIPVGRALNRAVGAHGARDMLLLAEPDDATWRGRLSAVEQLRKVGAEAAVFSETDGVARAYYLTAAAMRRSGPFSPNQDSFDALCREHAARACTRGARCMTAQDDGRGGYDLEPLGSASPRLGAGAALWVTRASDRLARLRASSAPERPRQPVRTFADRTVNITMLSYNRLEFTEQAVEAVRRRTAHPHRLVVVDNGSSPETVSWLQAAKRRGDIDVLVLNPQNLGVAVAANQGWRVCETDYYVKLDNDIVIEKDGWLEALVEAADVLPDAGMVGYNFESSSYPLREVAGLRVRPKASHLGGACVLIGPRAHRVAGFWCEDYFPYSEEDLDMGLRLRLAGLQHYYLEDESVGAHLPRGRATELAEHGALDDEDAPAYRQFKDEARRRHVGKFSTLWANRRLYESGAKSLHFPPEGPEAWAARLVDGYLGLRRRLPRR